MMNDFAAMDPIALHQANNAYLTRDDVLVPGYPGSGAAMLCNVLLSLGFRYVDPYTEVLRPGEVSSPAKQRVAYRRRISALAFHDAAANHGRAGQTRRFIKTHLYPDHFHEFAPRQVVLLVRDPRDAVHSYYRWRLAFSEEGERGTFDDFLARPTFTERLPALDWAAFNDAWQAWAARIGAHLHVLHFERLKAHGLDAIQALLGALGERRTTEVVAAALAGSSFESMQRHELSVAERVGNRDGLVMRRGKVQEWREWYELRHFAHFRQAPVLASASNLGYGEF